MTERDNQLENPDWEISNIYRLVETEKEYSLTEQAFLDVIFNRIEVVQFFPTTLYEGRIFALPNTLDLIGRVKVALAINTKNPPEKQGETLVHEVIHVDRNSWESTKGFSSFTYQFNQLKAHEEQIVIKATKPFYKSHKPLVAEALNHLKLRQEPYPLP